MNALRMTSLAALGFLLLFCVTTQGLASGIELTINGDFETGDTSGWSDFTTGSQSFGPTSFVSTLGPPSTTAGEIVNPDQGTASVIKQANLGIGQVSEGDIVTISFDAAGVFGVGGVAFAEFFTELDGGGTTTSVILGGSPLNAGQGLGSSYSNFSYTVPVGPTPTGGITLQFNAATGAVAGSTAQLFIDNVSVSIVPEPATAGLAGLGLIGVLGGVRRRK